MRLVFLYGPPGVGKLTVASALEARSGFKVFHNHLTLKLLLSVFDFGSEAFRHLREDIWLGVFREAAAAGTDLVFTFAPERTVNQSFIARTVEVVGKAGGQVIFVQLYCDESILRGRLESDTRRDWGKLNSWEEYEKLRDDGVFNYDTIIVPAKSIDIGTASPEEAAAEIDLFLENL